MAFTSAEKSKRYLKNKEAKDLIIHYLDGNSYAKIGDFMNSIRISQQKRLLLNNATVNTHGNYIPAVYSLFLNVVLDYYLREEQGYKCEYPVVDMLRILDKVFAGEISSSEDSCIIEVTSDNERNEIATQYYEEGFVKCEAILEEIKKQGYLGNIAFLHLWLNTLVLNNLVDHRYISGHANCGTPIFDMFINASEFYNENGVVENMLGTLDSCNDLKLILRKSIDVLSNRDVSDD